jgi:alanine racemase
VKNWIEISAQRLAANYRLLAQAVGPETSVLAVIKADAYGHGVDLCAPVLAAAGATWLGVTDAAEGGAARSALADAKISKEQQPRVLVMSEALEDDAEAVIEHNLTPVVSSIAQMESLAAQARGAKTVDVHLEIDSGMSRQGVPIGSALQEVLGWLKAQSAVRLDGVMTHFSSAEIAGSHQTTMQRSGFEDAVQQIVAAGLRPAWVHAGNTSLIDNRAAADADAIQADESFCWLRKMAHNVGARAMVRSGLGLYGYSLPIGREQGYAGPLEPRVQPHLQPVMTWKACVTGIREIEPGARVGYNGTFIADRCMRLALLPVGYADGLRRELSGTSEHAGGWVMFGESRAAIVGRVSMNLTTVDVTDIPSVAVGDEAVVLGAGVTAEDHARLARTISYEILCGVKAKRVLR